MIMKNRVKQIILWIFAVVYCMPFVLIARYSVLWSDDFSNYNRYCAQDGANHLVKSINFAKDIYCSWQGTFVSNFLVAFLHPTYWTKWGIGISTFTRMINVVIVVLLFISIYLCLRAVLTYIGIEKKEVIVAFCFVIVPLLSIRHFSEMFSWFTVMMVYTLPLGLALLSVFLFLNDKNNNILRILACILAFLASGGVLEVSGIISYISLTILIINWINNKKITPIYMLYFAMPFLGSLINVLAKGNYTRHEMIDGNRISIVRYLYFSVRVVLQTIHNLIIKTDTPFLLFLLLALTFGFFCKKAIDAKKRICVLVSISFFPVVVVFPVLLGYSMGDVNRLPIRAAFVFYCMIIAALELIAYIVGSYLGEKYSNGETKGKVVTFLGIMIIYALFTRVQSVESQRYFEVCDAIASGDLKKSSDSVYAIYNDIEASKDETIVLEAPKTIEWFTVMTFSDDPEFWVNVGLEQYFDKKAISFITREEQP